MSTVNEFGNHLLNQLLDYFDIVSYSQIFDNNMIPEGIAVKFKSNKTFKEITYLLSETDCSIVRLKQDKDLWILMLDYPFISEVKKEEKTKKVKRVYNKRK